MIAVQIGIAIAILAFIFWVVRRGNTGGSNDEHVAELDHRRFSEVNTFSLNIVGESNYQSAIKKCRPGDAVQVIPEPSNRYDPDAIVVKCRDQTIGYIGKDRLQWIHSALDHEHFSKITIERIGSSGKYLGVVLSIEKS